MANVSLVYNALKSLANKDQRGFVTPAIFNSFTQLAQQNVVDKITDGHTMSNNLRYRSLQGEKEISKYKAILEDLSFLTKNVALTRTSGVFSKPQDIFREISLSTFGQFMLGNTTSVPIDVIYVQSEIDDILTSRLSKPTESRPVAVMSDTIEVYPTSINKIKLRYYKIPYGINPISGARVLSAPRYGFTEVSAGREIYNPATSVDFELPDSTFPMLVIEMAKLIGINLSSEMVYTYAKQEEKSEQ